MNNYVAKIEFLGKKFRIKINANSKQEVQDKIKNSIKFQRISTHNEKTIGNSDVFESLKDIFGGL